MRELRYERGLRQEDLAGKINVSQQTISRIENGTNSIPADILIHLSRYFRVSADYILKLSDTRVTQECRTEVERKIEKGKDVAILLLHLFAVEINGVFLGAVIGIGIFEFKTGRNA